MDTDIAPTSLASGRTVPIGAECGGGVHDTPPGCAWQHGHEEYVWTPVWFTTSPHHGLVWSYPAFRRTVERRNNRARWPIFLTEIRAKRASFRLIAPLDEKRTAYLAKKL